MEQMKKDNEGYIYAPLPLSGSNKWDKQKSRNY
jgi:hypothetical protein